MTRVLEGTLVICLAVMAVLVFANVVLRYAFDSGVALSEELARLLFVWLIFLGAILASRQHAHIGFDSLVRKLPVRARKTVILANAALMLVACIFFVIGGWKQAVINLDNSYPVLGIAYAWLYAVAIVFGVGLALSIMLNVRDVLRGQASDEALVLTQDLESRVHEKVDRISAAQPTPADRQEGEGDGGTGGPDGQGGARDPRGDR
ncbi:MAG: TRAP transporter small permease [Gemmatimonadales bacterium]|nr:TRAP transporter small permease [Gemmatimonadales bacterium]